MSSSSEHTSSASAETSSDSGDSEKISTPPSVKHQEKGSPKKHRSSKSSPPKPSFLIKRPRETQEKEASKPSSSIKRPGETQEKEASKPSSSIKRPRETQEKEASKSSSKKSKKLAQEDHKEKASGATEAEKFAKKSGPIWNSKDEAAFLKRLVACCQKGKGLPKNLAFFYEAVGEDLAGDYSYHQLYNKFRGLRAKYGLTRDKIKDKGFPGFKNDHEESLYRMSNEVWGNREGDEEVGTEKAGKGGDARVKEKKKIVGLGGEREDVKRKKKGDVGMALKEQEGEEEEDEDESDDEEGKGHDQVEKNVSVNLSQHDTLKEMKTKKKKEGISHVSESMPKRVAGTGAQRSQVKVGEEQVSSEDNGGEEKDSSEDDEESDSESTDDENVPNVGLKGSRRVGTAGHYDSGENSRQHVAQGLSDRRKVAAAGRHDARENLSRPVQNETPDGRRRIATTNLPNNEENLAQHVPNGMANGSPCAAMTDQEQMFDQLCNEKLRILKGQLQDMLDEFKNEVMNIVNMAKKELQGSSNTARGTGFDFSMVKRFSSARELPSLSKTEAEVLDKKWQTQQLIEMEAASKHIAFLQEEYQLRMAKFCHQ